METEFRSGRLDGPTLRCLEHLEAALVGAGLVAADRMRGQFGLVRRFSVDGRIWFDALPARAWVLFYFSPAASRLAGLGFPSVRQVFEQAEERKDGIVKVRLFHENDAEQMVGLIRAVLDRVPTHGVRAATFGEVRD